MTTEPILQIRSRSWAYDFVLCAVVAVLSLTAYARSHSFGPGLVAGVIVVVPLMLRRLLPELALGSGVAGALGTLVVHDPPRLCMVAVPLLVYSLARFASPRTGQLALLAGLAGSLLGPGRWLLDRGINADSLLVLAVATAACAAITTAAYLTGRRRREGQENSADRAQSAAERERLIAAEEEQRTRMATVAERNRIARELHDIVAHSLSVIVVQAEGGRALATRRPEKGPEVLGTIAETSRQALEEMRRMVGLLRGGADAGPSYAPAPGLADIADLVSRTSEAVELTSYGTVPTVSPALGLTAYRIVQESLTNVLKHAGPAATTRVTMAYTVDSIEIEVADNGRGGAAVDGRGLGHGLQGMAERVALHGGSLSAEPRPGGGFVVRASLPQAGG